MSFNPIKSATEMVKKVRVSSVLSSLLWILPFTIAGLVVVSFTNNFLVQYFLMFVVGAIVIVFLFSFLGILIFGDKKLLQSEDHIFMMRALEVLGDQSHTYKDIKSNTLENNPSLPKPENSDSLVMEKIEKQDIT